MQSAFLEAATQRLFVVPMRVTGRAFCWDPAGVHGEKKSIGKPWPEVMGGQD